MTRPLTCPGPDAAAAAAGNGVEPGGGREALELTVTAPVVSFRNPLYAGDQVGLPCPPPATVGGMLAAAAGGWDRVDEHLRFAVTFVAAGEGVDCETYHPLDATGKKADPGPRDRDFLAGVRLAIWLVDDLDVWERRLRRPVWPLRLGRSQDLVGIRIARVALARGPGVQGHAVLPATATTTGLLLRLPTAVARDRSATRWDPYRYASDGSAATIDDPAGWSTTSGQAVVALTHVHPVHAERAGVG